MTQPLIEPLRDGVRIIGILARDPSGRTSVGDMEVTPLVSQCEKLEHEGSGGGPKEYGAVEITLRFLDFLPVEHHPV